MDTPILEEMASKWPETTILLNAGKAPAKFGEGVYELSAQLVLPKLLPKHGWQLIKIGRAKVRFKPPGGATKPFSVTTKIPTLDNVKELFEEFLKHDKPWVGYLENLPVFFIIQENTVYVGDPIAEPGEVRFVPHHKMPLSIWMTIGESTFWQARAHKRGDDIDCFTDDIAGQ